MWNAKQDESQAGTKIAGRNINNLRYVDDTTLKAGSEGELKSFLMRVKEESEKAGLKLQKAKIMVSGLITSCQIEWQKVESVIDFIFLGSKITVDGDCSHEIKRSLLLGRKAVTILDRVLRSKNITLPTKVCIVKAMVFPIVMWELDHKESWATNSWCFWIVVLEKTLEKLQYFGRLMERANSLEKTLMLGKIYSKRRRR